MDILGGGNYSAYYSVYLHIINFLSIIIFCLSMMGYEFYGYSPATCVRLSFALRTLCSKEGNT